MPCTPNTPKYVLVNMWNELLCQDTLKGNRLKTSPSPRKVSTMINEKATVVQNVAKSISKDWKTTLGGVLAGVGTILITNTGSDWMPTVGSILCVVGMVLLGTMATDKSKPKN